MQTWSSELQYPPCQEKKLVSTVTYCAQSLIGVSCHNGNNTITINNDSPTIDGGVLCSFIYRFIFPKDGVVDASLIWIPQFLDLKLISHKCVRHHAVNQKHERRSSTMYEGTQAPHHHHYNVFTGGKFKLDWGGNSRCFNFNCFIYKVVF